MKGKFSVLLIILVTIIALVFGYLYLQKVMVDFDVDENTAPEMTDLHTGNFAWNIQGQGESARV